MQTRCNRSSLFGPDFQANIGKPFPHADALAEQKRRLGLVDQSFAGKDLPEGYWVGEEIEMPDGRHVKILGTSGDGSDRIRVDHEGHKTDIHRDDLPPKPPAGSPPPPATKRIEAE